MLWIGGQITAVEDHEGLLIPSLINLLGTFGGGESRVGRPPVVPPNNERTQRRVFETSAF